MSRDNIISGTLSVFIFAIIVFFVLYFLVPEVSYRFFGISFNQEVVVIDAIKKYAEDSNLLTDEVLEQFQAYFSSKEGKALVRNVMKEVGSDAAKARRLLSSPKLKEVVEKAKAFVEEGKGTVSEFFTNGEGSEIIKSLGKDAG